MEPIQKPCMDVWAGGRFVAADEIRGAAPENLLAPIHNQVNYRNWIESPTALHPTALDRGGVGR